MNRNKVEAVFGPDARFELKPAPDVPFRAVLEDEFERLNAKLLREQFEASETPGLRGELRRAANEAGVLAWTTPFPLLFFPTLFEEKVRAAAQRIARQEAIRVETYELIDA